MTTAIRLPRKLGELGIPIEPLPAATPVTEVETILRAFPLRLRPSSPLSLNYSNTPLVHSPVL